MSVPILLRILVLCASKPKLSSLMVRHAERLLGQTTDVILGALCGSSYINEAFEELLVDRLSGESCYLPRTGEDMSRVIDRLLGHFERRDKRSIDSMFNGKVEGKYFLVSGLVESKKKGFEANRMRLHRYGSPDPCTRAALRAN
jgi:hypothetical protein